MTAIRTSPGLYGTSSKLLSADVVACRTAVRSWKTYGKSASLHSTFLAQGIKKEKGGEPFSRFEYKTAVKGFGG